MSSESKRRDEAALRHVQRGVARRTAALIVLAEEADARIVEGLRYRARGSSFEPSSTTTISKSWQVWARTEAIAVPRAWARL
jgi:hypothetical protein